MKEEIKNIKTPPIADALKDEVKNISYAKNTQKISYSEKLQDPRWISFRDNVKFRDNHCCVACGSNKNLHVHHKYYRNIEPWDYNGNEVVTLCSDCHEVITEILKLKEKHWINRHSLYFHLNSTELCILIIQVSQISNNKDPFILQNLTKKLSLKIKRNAN